MNSDKFKKSNQAIKKVTLLGAAVNVLLGLTKFTAGIAVNSIALTTDGVHSLSDLASDFAVLIGVKLSAKAPDKTHPYGHGRMETLSAFIIAAGLVVIGCYMIYYAGMVIASGVIAKPSIIAIVIALVSVLLKELLYQATRTVAVKYDCVMLYANAWHHRTDALSSLAVIAGIVSAYMGFKFGDQIAAIAVGVMIIAAGVSVFVKCVNEIADASVDGQTIKQIMDIVTATDGVAEWHNLRTRVVGREVFIDLHILVNPQLNIKEAHDISEALENSMHQQISQPVNIVIHIEPDISDQRKTAPPAP